jgi:hypothetical protein
LGEDDPPNGLDDNFPAACFLRHFDGVGECSISVPLNRADGHQDDCLSVLVHDINVFCFASYRFPRLPPMALSAHLANTSFKAIFGAEIIPQ